MVDEMMTRAQQEREMLRWRCDEWNGGPFEEHDGAKVCGNEVFNDDGSSEIIGDWVGEILIWEKFQGLWVHSPQS
ncbi:hypothetical protein V6N12_047547 [Hibiscus sabdariffa]|uniref:Uncharacterized protein n=1 Tax=Hibiscus sabdariffa TaxID=183260 RepID=A0ABR2DCW8_9ROSI